MTKFDKSQLPPLYDDPVILTATEHSELAYRKAGSFAFARRLNAVPVLLNEIPRLLAHYPIVFSAGKAPTFVALLGARDAENLFVRADGSWLPDVYVPAYLRRYPFIMTQLPDKQMVLSAQLDAAFFGPEGEPLFQGGNPTAVARAAYKFCSEFEQAFTATQRFCSAVADDGLLRSKRSTFTTSRGARVSLTGFSAVDEAVLDELDNRTANHYRKQHWLGALYCHVASLERLHTFPMLLDRRNAG